MRRMIPAAAPRALSKFIARLIFIRVSVVFLFRAIRKAPELMNKTEPQKGYPEINIKGNLGYGFTKVKRKMTPNEKFMIPNRIWVVPKISNFLIMIFCTRFWGL